jgi:putative ABC transport system permease protein
MLLDLRYAARVLRANPAFTIAAVLTLVLGVGGITTIFTVVRAVLLKPLEYRDPDRLVRISVDYPRLNALDGPFNQLRFDEMRAAARSFTDFAAIGPPESLAFSGDGNPEVLKAARVSANFLDLLGTPPMLGRSFLPEEDNPGGRPVVIISAELWQRRFAGDPLITGKAMTLDAIPYTITGVLPPGFGFPFTGADAWVPRPAEWSRVQPEFWRTVSTLTGFARLKPGITLEQARAELAVLNRQYLAAHPGGEEAATRVVWMKDQLVGNVRPMLWMLSGAVSFVLLIACANVASLLLARAASRSGEFAVRAAIGASRSRLIRQSITESLALATIGGSLGVFFAQWAVSAIVRLNVVMGENWAGLQTLPRSGGIHMDSSVLAFAVSISIATGVFFGLFPSLIASRPDLASALRASGERAGGASVRSGIFGLSTRGLLVAAQVALSIVLLIGAGLMLKSLARLHDVDPGFRTSNLLTVKIPLPLTRYNTDAKRSTFFDELDRRIETVPGVLGAAAVMTLPTTARLQTNVQVEGQPPPNTRDREGWQFQTVTPGYFQVLGIPLRRGRTFTSRDNIPGATATVVINEGLARRYWPAYPRGQDPVGQHLVIGLNAVPRVEIVGIVADVHEGGLASDARPEFYIPSVLRPPQTAYLMVRTQGDPLHFVGSIRGQVLAIDRNQAVSDFRTMEAVYEMSVGQRRLTMLLLGSFAVVALLLAMVGIYGVIAYSVAQRTREMGIRRALGAEQGDILRLVLSQVLGLTLAGVALGDACAVALTRMISSQLFHTSATDPITFASISLLFFAVALAATWIPAHRAARVDPMTALR